MQSNLFKTQDYFMVAILRTALNYTQLNYKVFL